MRNGRGFTLAELTIVVMLAGFFAVILFTYILGTNVQTKNAEVEKNMQTLQLAIEDFAISGGRYPDSLNDRNIDGLTVFSFLSEGVTPRNPYSKRATEIRFSSTIPHVCPGDIIWIVVRNDKGVVIGYRIKGYDHNTNLMGLVLKNI